MVNGAIETVLWPGVRKTVGSDLVLGGILANKTGYHNSRNRLLRDHPDDYSIQLAIDKQGPGELGSAIDLTFRSAQGGDYRNIAKYSKRLYQAGVDKDPRAYPMREFFGNTDHDTEVEGWSYYRGRAASSDKSHLWHIHISIHRKYINDEAAMRSILEIWNGEEPMPSLSEIREVIREELQRPEYLRAAADAFLDRDGKIDNHFTGNPENTHVAIKTALSVLGERTKPEGDAQP